MTRLTDLLLLLVLGLTSVNALAALVNETAGNDTVSTDTEPLKNNSVQVMQRARKLIYQGQLTLAGEVLQKWLAETPSTLATQKFYTAQAYLLLAQVARLQNRLDDARKDYQRVLSMDVATFSALAYLQLFDLDADSNNLQKSYQAIEQISHHQPLKRELSLRLLEQVLEAGQDRLIETLIEQLEADQTLSSVPRLYARFLALKARRLHQQQPEQALQLLQRAIFLVQQQSDLLMKFEWLQAQWQEDQLEASLAAYRRANFHLQQIRQSIPVHYIDGKSSYRQMLEPFYLAYTQQLLRWADQQTDVHKQQQALKQAQLIQESLKESEIHDYFRNNCEITPQPISKLIATQDNVAIIYPILFEQQLSILLSVGNHLQHISVKLDRNQFQRTLLRAVSRLRPMADGRLRHFRRRELEQLYRWLVQPLEPVLQQHQIDTLAFVPDSILRMLPLASLWDGKQFLVEKYAVVTLPGLTLTTVELPQADWLEARHTLLAGLSQPGDVVRQLPEKIKQGFLLSQSAASRRGFRGKLTTRSLPLDARLLAHQPSGQRKIAFTQPIQKEAEFTDLAMRQIQQLLALPGVEQEVQALAAITATQPMLNEQFKLAPFVKQSQDASIIHIASHGVFSGDPQSSFIMTYDKILDMNQLADLLRAGQKKNSSAIELVVLSACQTAEGDDRSPLGLSGVALKSGARSILGSLWPISDDAATLVFPEFYRQLKQQPLLSKARALQKVQQKLIASKDMSHPFYWAAFVLVGNWL